MGWRVGNEMGIIVGRVIGCEYRVLPVKRQQIYIYIYIYKGNERNGNPPRCLFMAMSWLQ